MGRFSGRMRPVALLAAALIVWVLSAAWQATAAEDSAWNAPARAARKKNPVPSDDKSIAAGKTVFVKECQSCHGTAGKGDGPAAKDLEKGPGDLSSAKVQEQSDGAIFWKVTEGRKPMPSFSSTLSDDQRWQVINYVRTLAAKAK
jgi:mono/diheme cytochrome c family protein